MGAQPPKILHCINSLAIGGAEMLLRDTIQLLDDFDHVICYLNKPDDLLNAFGSNSVYCLDHKSWWDSFKTIQKLRKIIRSHNIALVHAHIFDSTLIARLACPKDVKFLFTVHNPLSKDAFMVNRKSLFAEKLTYKKRQNIIGVSKLVLDDYNEWVGIKGFNYVLYNYVNEKFFNLHYKNGHDVKNNLRLVAVGNLRTQKNYFNLIEAFSLLKNEKISLDIYGEGNLRAELQKAIDVADVKIDLKGRVSDVSEVLLNYDAYIMPSFFEGFGIAAMEAMATGMPVLLSDIEIFRELADGIPLYFDPHQPESIAGAINDFLLNSEMYIEKARLGKHAVYAKSSKEKYIQDLRTIYDRILNAHP